MFKKLCFDIGSFSLAILVLLSSFSFSIHKHYCGHFLKDTSYVVPSKGCGMEKAAETLQKFCKDSQITKSCCEDETHIVDGIDVVSSIKHAIHLDYVAKLPDETFEFYNTEIFIKPYYLKSSNDPPPSFSRQLYLHYQSFLI